MWWAVPDGIDSFSTWQEVTTVYHEGVPGHHLQVAQTAVRAETLNRWQRLVNWCSGHGEGWALYSERLMDELGYLDEANFFLGNDDHDLHRRMLARSGQLPVYAPMRIWSRNSTARIRRRFSSRSRRFSVPSSMLPTPIST